MEHSNRKDLQGLHIMCVRHQNPEVYIWGSLQASMTKLVAKIVKGFKLLTNSAKRFIIDVWQGPKYDSIMLSRQLHVQG